MVVSEAQGACSGRQNFLKPRMTAAFPGDSSFHSIRLSPLRVTPQKVNWCSVWKLCLSDSRCCWERPFSQQRCMVGKQLYELGFTSLFSFSGKSCHSLFTDEETRAASGWAFCWRSQDSVISALRFTSIEHKMEPFPSSPVNISERGRGGLKTQCVDPPPKPSFCFNRLAWLEPTNSLLMAILCRCDACGLRTRWPSTAQFSLFYFDLKLLQSRCMERFINPNYSLRWSHDAY